MGTKLDKGSFPSGHKADDFKCFGPPALKDGEFDSAKICDLGCFTQDGKDSNKYYHAAICQSKKTSKWFVYFEWGRTGASKADYQFVQCDSEFDAQDEFISQLMSKNVKRGEWATIGGIKTLRAKAGKDCYLVRPMSLRSVGLPDGKTITINDKVKALPSSSSTSATPKLQFDSKTIQLMKDLNVATVSYTRTSMANDSIPTQSAIDEARTILIEAQKRIAVVGDNVDNQVKDRTLSDLTNMIYSRIPKVKRLGAAPQDWILSSSNIVAWGFDLDAFESVGSSSSATEVNPFADMQIDMEWIDKNSELGSFIAHWWANATANKHGGLGKLNVMNIWKLQRHEDVGKIEKFQKTILGEVPAVREKPLFQPSKRKDLTANEDVYQKTNTSLLFHGTRSVNVSGILKKSLMLPKQLVGVAMTGALFGPGIYWADDWKKSAGYTSLSSGYYTSGSGGVRSRGAFMFAGDVVLGNPYVASYKAYSGPPKGHHCVFGKAHKSGVQNNEWIVYNGAQFVLRYLIEFSA